jgi:hypothetical protein
LFSRQAALFNIFTRLLSAEEFKQQLWKYCAAPDLSEKSVFFISGSSDSNLFGITTPALSARKRRASPKLTLLFHNKGEYISARIAGTEAMPALLFRVNKKRGLFFTVKRTQRPHIFASFGQFGILTYNFYYIQLLLYFINSTHS